MSRQVALIVGAGQYDKSTGLRNLKAPVNDANALYDLLKKYSDFDLVPLPKGRREDGAYCVGDRSLSAAEFAAEFQGIFTASPNTAPQEVLLYFSGHGTRKTGLAAQAGSCLACSDDRHAFPLRDLCEAIENSAVSNVVVILDCCHSGEVHDFFTRLQGKRFCLIAAASAEAEALAVSGHSLLTQIVLEALNPEQHDVAAVKTNHLVEFIENYPDKPPNYVPPSGVSYEFFTLTKRPAPVAPVSVSGPQPGLQKPPYKGLEAFREEDADIFFGRETLIEKLLERLATQRFLAVLGASGSGKSSLVRAGLVPKLRQGHVHGKAWQVVQMRPSHDPLGILSYELHNLFPRIQLATADYDAQTLGHALTEVAGEAQVLLLIDQFEEVFTECRDAAKREAFFACLVGAVHAENPLHAVITLRADFLGKCTEQDYHGLARRIQADALLLTPLNVEALQAVITQPLQHTGKQLAPDLLSQLIDESLHEKGSLPLLQHALVRLWETAAAQQADVLTVRMYQDLSGVDSAQSGLRGLLNQKINDFYQHLPAEQQHLMQWLFLELVQLGEGIEDTRKTLLEVELIQRHPQHATAVQALLDELKSRERLLTGDANQDKQAIVTIAHEALIRDWGQLRSWLDEHRELKRWRERLAGDLRDWQATGENVYLLRDGRLLEAEEKLAEYQDNLLIGQMEREFIAESVFQWKQALAEKRRQQQRWIVFVTVFFVVALGLSGLAGWKWWESGQNLTEANKNFVLAEEKFTQSKINQSRMLAGLSEIEFNKGNISTAMRLALEALPKSSETYPNRKFVIAAYHSLTRAINHQYQGVFEHGKTVKDALFSPDGNTLFTRINYRAYLWNVGTRQLIAVLNTDNSFDNITSPGFSPDSAYIAIPSWESGTSLWDAKTGKLLVILQSSIRDVATDKLLTTGNTPGFAVPSARFNPDGTRIVTASWDNNAYIWDARTYKQLIILKGHQHFVNTARFNTSGTRIITASEDQAARLWCAKTGELLAILEGHTARVKSARFSPDNTRIATVSDDHTAKIWDANTGSLLFTLQGHTEPVVSARFNYDGKQIVTAGDKTARLWDVNTGNLVFILQGHSDTVNSAHFSPDGTQIATAANDHSVRLWDVHTGNILSIVQGHTEIVNSVHFSPNGKYIVTASQDSKARLWQAQTGKPPASLLGHTRTVSSAAFSPDGQRVVTASYDETARLWDARNGEPLAVLKGHTWNVYSAAFSPDGQRIITASGDNTARLWDARNGEPLEVLQGHKRQLTSAAFSPDGQQIITASVDETVRLWNAHSGEPLAVLKGHNKWWTVNSAVFSPDGQLVVTASHNTARLWDVHSGEPLVVLQGHTKEVNSAAFSPDGQRIVTASADHSVRLWDTHSGQSLAMLQGHTHNVTSAAFSPNGQRIVTASWDKTARLWDADSGQPLAVLQEHKQPLSSAAFSVDGQRIVTTSWDGTARLWNAQTGKPLIVLGHGSIPFENKTRPFWFTFTSVEEVIAYAQKMLLPRYSDIANFRLTCNEREQFFLEELERCKENAKP